MDKLSKYYGVLIFVGTFALLGFIAFNVLMPKLADYNTLKNELKKQETLLKDKQQALEIVAEKIRKINTSIASSTKKVYYPMEADLGNDTLFFTLYNDVIEMVHNNSVKIKNIDYVYNPEGDKFVVHGKDKYFVCDVNFDLVSNFINLGKLIEAIYQYPYYVKINSLSMIPFEGDKKVILSKLSLRLYAHTEPEEKIEVSMPNS